MAVKKSSFVRITTLVTNEALYIHTLVFGWCNRRLRWWWWWWGWGGRGKSGSGRRWTFHTCWSTSKIKIRKVLYFLLLHYAQGIKKILTLYHSPARSEFCRVLMRVGKRVVFWWIVNRPFYPLFYQLVEDVYASDCRNSLWLSLIRWYRHWLICYVMTWRRKQFI